VPLLRKKIGAVDNISTTLPPVSMDNILVIEPLHKMDYGWVKRGKKFVTEALVQWKHLLAKDATWEEVEQIQQQFP
jgi:hypothetical protein